MIEVKNLSFSYNDKETILKDVSLTVNPGEIVALIAPSGYGKTTLGKIISGYLKPDEGEVTVDGKDIMDYEGFKPVQLVHQHPEKSIDPKWKVRKILNEGWQVNEDVKTKFGIKEFWLEKFPQELSGGELQRICLARAMSDKCKYLVADEITTMVDSITQVQLSEVLLHFVREHGVGILFISHNVKLLERIADRTIDLREINKR